MYRYVAETYLCSLRIHLSEKMKDGICSLIGFCCPLNLFIVLIRQTSHVDFII